MNNIIYASAISLILFTSCNREPVKYRIEVTYTTGDKETLIISLDPKKALSRPFLHDGCVVYEHSNGRTATLCGVRSMRLI